MRGVRVIVSVDRDREGGKEGGEVSRGEGFTMTARPIRAMSALQKRKRKK